MPISRKKTCVQCRRAKTRCSLTLPRCTRCVDKSLSCEYALVTVPRMVPYSVTNPQSEDLRDAPAELRSLAARHGLVHGHQHGQGIPPCCVVIDSLGMADASSSPPLSSATPAVGHSENRSDNWPAALHVDLGAETGLDTGGASTMPPIEPCQNVFGFINAINMASHPTPNGTSNDEDNRLRSPLTGSGTQSDYLVHDKTSRILTKRRGLNANTILTTRTIMGQHESYDSETMLEAIQALTIYLLLQAQDTDTLGRNDVKYLLLTLAEIGRKLHMTLEYNTYVDTLENPLNRSTWALYEGARRTLCLLYVVEMFLEVNFRQSESRCCQSFAAAPLPCIRELWEVPSTYEWRKRYSAFLRYRAAEKILTLADYKLSQHLSVEEIINGPTSGEGCGAIIKDVTRWCEGLDQFGTLIVLAATLVKYELGPSTMGGNGYVKIA
ncbi:hypothetical protein TARUN_1475 [Trichoderma arundinaceum]|uniref:Zn(2)-C6 fungal-type domain-containing protein n=1 Tax=Trichoderma arundinaceum TaxID=490622 RepID=A0A395NX78_TRIAR|nr:hypothetical protein TARUN_1475 [Trichoderma arundinaceum]